MNYRTSKCTSSIFAVETCITGSIINCSCNEISEILSDGKVYVLQNNKKQLSSGIFDYYLTINVSFTCKRCVVVLRDFKWISCGLQCISIGCYVYFLFR